MDKRTLNCLPNYKLTHGGNSLLTERFGSHDHPKIAFGMDSMGAYNNTARNIEEFGGEPFYTHGGK